MDSPMGSANPAGLFGVLSGGAGGAGLGALGSASMLTGGIGAVGLGLEAFGAIEGMGVAKKESQVSMQEAQSQEDIDRQKFLQMSLQNDRAKMQNLRTGQQAQALNKAAAANQGALFGSGYAGGQGQARNVEAQSSRDLSQNFQIGKDTFSDTLAVDQDKIQMAGLQGQQAKWSALTSVGGSLVGSSRNLGGVFGS